VRVLKLSCLLGLVLAVSGWAAKWPQFTGKDAKRPTISVQLQEWATELPQITFLAFVPGKSDRLLVLCKEGDLWSVSRSNPKDRMKLLHLDVLTDSELGLLGLAFHPRFDQNRKIYLNFNPVKGEMRTRISEWILPSDTTAPQNERLILEYKQPYQNHNGGNLLFGADGYLYIGTGDGGLAADPHGNGQSPTALLGKMLRIDVDGRVPGKPYGIPTDNPFLTEKKFAPEIWALGLRNPWRYTFDGRGRLIVADVGQNKWEEVSIVEAGKNYGWRFREASHCFNPEKNCPTKNLIDPWLEYGRDDGASITGGYVYTGDAVTALKGKYVFGDFVTGRIWAQEPPASDKQTIHSAEFYALGQWPLSISTFGKDPKGEIYVADFAKGAIHKIVP
jgi:glucose/arabinose dehydrogenase